MLTTLDHVILAVEDLNAATRSMACLLGRSPSWRGEHPGAGTANTLFRLENTYLELLAAEGEGPVGAIVKGWIAEKGQGPVGLAFGTDDAEACRKQLAEAGLEPGELDPGIGRDVDSGAFRKWTRVPLPLEKTRGVLLFPIEHHSPPDILPHALAFADESACVFGLDHAVVQSADPEATKRLYGDGLGLRLALDKEFPQWGTRLLFFRVGGVTVEVAARLHGSAEPGEDPSTDVLWGLSYRVADADAARSRLEAAGIDVSEVRSGRKPGTRVFSVKDGTLGVPTLVLEPAQR